MPADPCDPNFLASQAKCFTCLSPASQLEVQTYLLAVLAGTSTDPNILQGLSKNFEGISAQTLLEIQVYLLCQILNK